MLRIGLMGAGGMGAARARAADECDGAKVVAVCSRRRETAAALADSLGATAFTDRDRFLDAVDAVVVAIPNVLHAEAATAALAAGKHVLVEYPLCSRWRDATQLRDRAHQTGQVLMVGNTIVHEAMFGFVSARLERLGELRSAASRVAFHDPAVAAAWYLRPELTGPVFAAYHYHHIEYYRRLLGEVVWVDAHDEGVAAAAGDRLSFAGGTLLMGHVGGATSCIQWYLSEQGRAESRVFQLTGTADALTIVSHEPGRSLAVWGGGGPGGTETFAEHWGVTESTREFVAAIDGAVDHQRRLDSDLRTLQVGLLAGASAVTRERVAVPPAEPTWS